MKTSLKLFEFNTRKTNYEKGNYKNPEPGLVVLDKVTDTNKFEFYFKKLLKAQQHQLIFM